MSLLPINKKPRKYDSYYQKIKSSIEDLNKSKFQNISKLENEIISNVKSIKTDLDLTKIDKNFSMSSRPKPVSNENDFIKAKDDEENYNKSTKSAAYSQRINCENGIDKIISSRMTGSSASLLSMDSGYSRNTNSLRSIYQLINNSKIHQTKTKTDNKLPDNVDTPNKDFAGVCQVVEKPFLGEKISSDSSHTLNTVVQCLKESNKEFLNFSQKKPNISHSYRKKSNSLLPNESANHTVFILKSKNTINTSKTKKSMAEKTKAETKRKQISNAIAIKFGEERDINSENKKEKCKDEILQTENIERKNGDSEKLANQIAHGKRDDNYVWRQHQKLNFSKLKKVKEWLAGLENYREVALTLKNKESKITKNKLLYMGNHETLRNQLEKSKMEFSGKKIS